MTSTPTIPPPTSEQLFFGATHKIAGITLDGLDIVYTSNQVAITFSVRSARAADRFTSLDLSDALAGGVTIGKKVVHAASECDGTIADSEFSVTGAPHEIAGVREAITHFYADESDAMERKLFRAIYQRLAQEGGASPNQQPALA